MKKELYRSENKIVFGICGGLAEYFEADITLFRLVLLFMLIFLDFSLLVFSISLQFLSCLKDQKS